MAKKWPQPIIEQPFKSNIRFRPVFNSRQNSKNKFDKNHISNYIPKLEKKTLKDIYFHRFEQGYWYILLIAIKPYQEKPKPRPFFSSTPATYLVNPSTAISTLRPVVRPTTPKNRVIHVTTAVPENVHVTVTRYFQINILYLNISTALFTLFC